MGDSQIIPVRVAVRSRPLVSKEVSEGCETCVNFVADNDQEQIILGTDKAFTYDYVFAPTTPQVEVYERAVSGLVQGLFKGYNATVLAYGQTGSGKTFSMGGGYSLTLDTDSNDEVGIIPRVICDIFKHQDDEFDIALRVSYLEIYKEDLLDLLKPNPSKDPVTIREEAGTIKLVGLTERPVSTPQQMMQCLLDGAMNRTTAATAMNSTSSRSHAIFTIYIDKTSKQDSSDVTRSKFHLVDLAGSERQKKTKAEGERLKEGININKGLLSLGNVISALGDEAQRAKYVPYRDSKLTRLLQDSLGGNSHTVMIACVSPADSNMEETLSTLRYADRARKIKNKPIVNVDPQVAEIRRLKKLVADLQTQVVPGSGGVVTGTCSTVSAQQSEEIAELRAQNTKLKAKVATLERDLAQAWEQNGTQSAHVIQLEMQRDLLQVQIESLKEAVEETTKMVSSHGDGEACKSASNLQERINALEKTFNGDLTELAASHGLSLAGLGNESLETVAMEGGDESLSGRRSGGTSSHDTDVEQLEAEHEEKSAARYRNLNDLNKLITDKVQLYQNMQGNKALMEQLNECEGNIKEKEELISKLQTEKDDLETQLKQPRVASISKVNEQRRKRIQELETTLKDQKKALSEATRMLKVKESSRKDMERLKHDITDMKQQRVKLMKQIKADGEQFRKFKAKKEKEVIQLQAAERKRVVELNKLKGKFDLQQNVLKRKNEEAAALSKRLNENLMKQRRAADDRAKREHVTMAAKKAKIIKMLNDELELEVGIAEARVQKEELLVDRKQLSKQLAQLKEEMETAPPRKRRGLNDSVETSQSLKVKEIELQIQVKSSHIQDLSEKILEADQNTHGRKPFEDLKIGSDYRIALSHLVSKVKSSRIALSKQRHVNEEFAHEAEEYQQKLHESRLELEEIRMTAERERIKLQTQHEQQISSLLSAQLRDNALGGESAEGNNQEIKQVLEEKDKEINQLRQELTKRAYVARLGSQRLMPSPPGGGSLNETVVLHRDDVISDEVIMGEEEDDAAFFSQALVKTREQRKAKRRTLIFEQTDDDDDADDEEVEFESGDENRVSESEGDVEWSPGQTPGYGQIRILPVPRRSRLPFKLMDTNEQQLPHKEPSKRDKEPSKRGSSLNSSEEGLIRCGCVTTCSTKKCSCVRQNVHCHAGTCACKEGSCCNREPMQPESTTTEDMDTSTTDISMCGLAKPQVVTSRRPDQYFTDVNS